MMANEENKTTPVPTPFDENTAPEPIKETQDKTVRELRDVPVETVPFGWQTTAARLAKLGADPILRKAQDGTPFRTDGGNLILDCHFGVIADPIQLEQDLSATIGVVETGLFIGMATTALVATPGGILRLDR